MSGRARAGEERRAGRKAMQNGTPEASKPKDRPLSAILEDLRKKPKQRHLSTKKQGGQKITYMPWYNICDYLDHYAPGWEWDIEVTVGHDRLFVVGKLTIYGSDRSIRMAATGTERLDTDSWGDPSSNAEAQALRRAACKLGFCRHLWKK